ncbi:MAG TPA: divergent polysaccharide deacetylase family protein [Firmicutes bacterium]|nr:divergent polysaccharide deacetylase family protein [Bacillota bacterium]
MKRAVLCFLLLLLSLAVLAGCGLFPGRRPAPGETGEEEKIEEMTVPVADVDRALEAALARGGRYLIVADETQKLDRLVPGPPRTRVSWNRRALRVSLPEEPPLDSYLAALEEELAAVEAGISGREEGDSQGARVVTLKVGISPEIAGRPIPLVTHELTLIQGKTSPPPQGKLAIIIDDFGGGVAGTAEMMELDVPLTFAVIPYRRASQAEAREARERGYQVLLHMPMEPLNEKLSPGPGAITAGMTPEEIKIAVAAALEEVPGAVGVNNHMGSKVTAREELMLPFLEAVGERGLFFIDSRTTNKSVAAALARQLGIPVAENRLFLDNEKEPESIKKQLRRAAELAREEGEFIAIGHVHPAMVQALREFLPELEGLGVELVFASQLARR